MAADFESLRSNHRIPLKLQFTSPAIAGDQTAASAVRIGLYQGGQGAFVGAPLGRPSPPECAAGPE